jgi:hypothetical protein
MSKLVLLNTRTFAGAVDLTGVSNKATIGAKVDGVDVTNYGSAGWTELLGGLAATDIAIAGFFESGLPGVTTFEDPELFAQFGAVGPWTMAPDGMADSAVTYLTNALECTYQVGDEVGKAAPFEATAAGVTKLVRGVIGHPPGTARTATGTGTANQVGALTANQSLYCNLHVYSVSGTTPSITVRIESDNAVGFPSPVTVGTFTAATGLGGQHMRIAGPITDDWFRAAWTISGTTPSFLFVVSFGRA